MRRYVAGFTLIELVVVLVLLGIVATYVAPRFTGLGGYAELTAQKNIQQALRYAQQLAMTQTDQTITFTTNAASNQIDVRIGANSAPRPGGSSGNFAATYPEQLSNVNLTSADVTIVYDRLGRAAVNGSNAGAVATIAITGPAQTLSVRVEGETGYAH